MFEAFHNYAVDFSNKNDVTPEAFETFTRVNKGFMHETFRKHARESHILPNLLIRKLLFLLFHANTQQTVHYWRSIEIDLVVVWEEIDFSRRDRQKVVNLAVTSIRSNYGEMIQCSELVHND